MVDEKDENEGRQREPERSTDDRSPRGSERDADAERPGGPRYHGAGWERADEEEKHGGEPVDRPRADDPQRVEPGAVPGAKGKETQD